MKRGHLWGIALGVLIAAGGVRASGADIPCEDGKRYYLLGRQAGASQDLAKAIDWLHRSVDACASYPAWHLLGTALQKQGRLEESLAAYENAVQHAADRDQAALSMARYGQGLALNGQRFEALTMLERAIGTHSSPPSWMLDSARELDQSLAGSKISSDSIKRSLAAQEFGLLAMNDTASGGADSKRIGASVRIPINYKLDSAEMDELTSGNILELGKVLSGEDYASKTFTLIGHSDVRGGWDYNMVLSEQRAEAARLALESDFPSLQGRLRTMGAGESRPKYPGENLSESDHRLNRRLEVIVN